MLSRYLLSTLSALSLLLSIVSGCPGPDCEAAHDESPAPVYLISIKPCDECHQGADQSPQRAVSTITYHRCASKSIVPYTSGSSTFWLSTPSCPSQTTVTSWMPQSDTCAAPQSGGLATKTLPAVTFTSYAPGSPPATVFLPASTPSPITHTTILSGSCVPSEIYHPGSTYWGTATQLTTVTSTIVKTESYPGPTVNNTLPASTQVVTYTRPGETIVTTLSESARTITLTTGMDL
jgi:hypothetical protein